MQSSSINNFPKELVKREHEFEAGHCKHCGETVGNASWLNCIDRVPDIEDFPDDVKSYINFRGLKYEPETGEFVQAYGDRYTVSEIFETVNNLKKYKYE